MLYYLNFLIKKACWLPREYEKVRKNKLLMFYKWQQFEFEPYTTPRKYQSKVFFWSINLKILSNFSFTKREKHALVFNLMTLKMVWNYVCPLRRISRKFVFSFLTDDTCTRNTVASKPSNTFTQKRAISVRALSQGGTIIRF